MPPVSDLYSEQSTSPVPKQGTLAQIASHERWLRCLAEGGVTLLIARAKGTRDAVGSLRRFTASCWSVPSAEHEQRQQAAALAAGCDGISIVASG